MPACFRNVKQQLLKPLPRKDFARMRPLLSPRMDLRSPGRLAAIIAVCGALAAMAGAWWLRGLVDAWIPLLGAGTMVVTYLVALFLVRRFVLQRVDLIHRTIHNAQKGTTGQGFTGADPLEAASGRVSAWAAERRSEITELKERERFRREFIGNLAHELRTPIFSIQGYILTLLEGGLEDVKVNRDFLERASNGVDRLIRIVEDLDMITQLESGVMRMEMARLDLNAPVNEMIGSLEMRAKEKQITLRNELAEEVMVRADHDRLLQVFGNLFNNAINYGSEGGWCVVRSFDVGDRVMVEVVDNGIGIAEEHLPRLFERFYRVGKSRARNEGGSGLGLAIVKHIVEAHGGTITVKSAEGAGTTFAFTLPRSK